MNEQDLLLIERYYRAELDETERAAFEKRLAADEVFREEALLHAQALEAIRLHGKELFKQQLAARPLLPAKRSYWPWIGIAGVLLLVAVFFYTQHTPSDLTPNPQPTSNPDTLQHQKQQGITPDTSPKQVPINTPPQTPKKLDKEGLFAAAYERFEDVRTKEAGQRGEIRGQDATQIFDSFLKAYQNKQYAEALQTFGRLPESAKKDGNNLFYYANALMASRQIPKAATIFEQIIKADDSDFPVQAEWYAALCALKQGDLQKAKRLLEKVKSSQDKKYADKAIDLLGKLAQ